MIAMSVKGLRPYFIRIKSSIFVSLFLRSQTYLSFGKYNNLNLL